MSIFSYDFDNALKFYQFLDDRFGFRINELDFKLSFFIVVCTKIFTKQIPTQIPCEYCVKVFLTEGTLSGHKTRHHRFAKITSYTLEQMTELVLILKVFFFSLYSDRNRTAAGYGRPESKKVMPYSNFAVTFTSLKPTSELTTLSEKRRQLWSFDFA